MKAIRFHQYGDTDVLRYEDVAVPDPGAGQVRVRVAGTTFNGVDANIRAGNMQGPMPLTLPHVPGLDLAGTVDALGTEVDGLAVGDRVVGFLPFVVDGASADYVLAPAESLAAAPTSIPLADAAALPLVGLTAWQALFDTPTSRPASGSWSTAPAEPSAATPCSWPGPSVPASSLRAPRATSSTCWNSARTRSSTTPPPTRALQ
jgi:NADPH:quinone reductase-like Zn-dependent oxidoreductase